MFRASRANLKNRTLAAIVCAMTMVAACARPDAKPQTPPRDESIVWTGKGGGFAFWGDCGEYVYAASVTPRVLEVYKWTDGTLKQESEVPLAGNVSSAQLLSGGRYVAESWRPTPGGIDSLAGRIESIVEIRHLKTGDLRAKSVVAGDGMDHHEISRPSANGRHVVFWKSIFTARLGAQPHSEIRFGLIDTKTGQIDWVGLLTGRDGADGTMRTVVPSDDGRYIAVAGWDDGVAVLDVARKKVLWTKGYEVDCVYIAFSPDIALVYAGGMKGIVYGMEVKTGKIVSKWFASESGKEEYGHRISTISVSPDGRYVAAGTGPEGHVFVFSTKTGKLVKRLDHGGLTILITSFSPDSKRLASVAAGRIKIWRMPEESAPEPDKAASKNQ